MPIAEVPDPHDPDGEPAGKSLSQGSAAATESGMVAYDKDANADDGGGKAALKQKRKDELPKSVLDD